VDLENMTPETFDYTYINWSTIFAHVKEVPGDYPLAYDRTLANHVGRGVYVIKVDGTVIWDEGAYWIRRFSAQHPEYRVPVPREK
jgi:hypothetical protein